MIQKWKTLSSKRLYQLKIMEIWANRRLSPKKGTEHEFYAIHSNDWINVVPVTHDGRIVMVSQFRHGNEEITLEVPGGLVDDGEEPIHSAARELQEETGYTSDPLIQLGYVSPNPALFNNTCHTFLASNAQLTHSVAFDGTEDIEISLHSLDEISKMIESGRITHSLTINAIYWYEKYLSRG
ncbi:MAG: NUDIX hydrolase [Chloroflexota bacterium]